MNLLLLEISDVVVFHAFLTDELKDHFNNVVPGLKTKEDYKKHFNLHDPSGLFEISVIVVC